MPDVQTRSSLFAEGKAEVRTGNADYVIVYLPSDEQDGDFLVVRMARPEAGQQARLGHFADEVSVFRASAVYCEPCGFEVDPETQQIVEVTDVLRERRVVFTQPSGLTIRTSSAWSSAYNRLPWSFEAAQEEAKALTAARLFDY